MRKKKTLREKSKRLVSEEQQLLSRLKRDVKEKMYISFVNTEIVF